ncbi:NUDIX hydrolase [Peribacillus sp. SCS-155]|uniref:NUDIX hydrolase n=1 Tax=Peribacillus sedimenti TaxID=3115297 RepID=UPI003905DD98
MHDYKNATSVHGDCFNKGNILLVDPKRRGYNIPGGHVEIGEIPEQALHREAYEEGMKNGKYVI